jgi:hypothetical protein
MLMPARCCSAKMVLDQAGDSCSDMMLRTANGRLTCRGIKDIA